MREREATAWRPGDRVRSIPEHAWVFDRWAEKLAKPRGGVVIEVPLETREAGEGTIRVEWDALHGEKADPEAWRMWIHSRLVERETTEATECLAA